MRVNSLSIPLLLSLTWPSTRWELVGVGYIVLFLLVCGIKGLAEIRWLRFPALALSLLALLSFLHIFYSGSWYEIVDLVRILPLAAAALYARQTNLEQLYTTFFWLGLASLAAIYLLKFGYFTDFIEALHARNLEESYGRHSGLFLNVSTLGIFAMSWFFLAIALLIKRGFALHFLISILAAIVLLLQSGSKTQLVATACVVSALGIFRLFRGKLLAAVLTIAVIGTPLFLHTIGAIYLHQITKLQGLVEFGLPAVSSLQARFHIWWNYGHVWASDPLWVLFGAPKAALDVVGNTYDSDLAWVLFRYGVFAAVGFAGIVGVAIYRGATTKSPLLPAYLAMVISCSFIGVMTAFQIAFFYWLVTFMICLSPSTASVNYYRRVRYT